MKVPTAPMWEKRPGCVLDRKIRMVTAIEMIQSLPMCFKMNAVRIFSFALLERV